MIRSGGKSKLNENMIKEGPDSEQFEDESDTDEVAKDIEDDPYIKFDYINN